MLSKNKYSVEKYLAPIIKPLSGVSPNTLTLLGSIPPLLFFVLVLSHHLFLALFAFVGNFFDFLDGMVARRYNKVSSFGGFLDSTFDRIADFFSITAFAFGKIVRWEIAAPLVLFAFLTSYIRSRGEQASENKVKFAVGFIERGERLALIFLALVLYLLFPTLLIANLNIAEWVFLLLVFLSCYTVIQRITYAQKKLI